MLRSKVRKCEEYNENSRKIKFQTIDKDKSSLSIDGINSQKFSQKENLITKNRFIQNSIENAKINYSYNNKCLAKSNSKNINTKFSLRIFDSYKKKKWDSFRKV